MASAKIPFSQFALVFAFLIKLKLVLLITACGYWVPSFSSGFLWFFQESFIGFQPDKVHFVLTRIEFEFWVSFLSGFRFFYNCIRS